MLKKVIFSKDMKWQLEDHENVLHYPEKDLGPEEQNSFSLSCPGHIEYIVTTSAFIISSYDRSIVYYVGDNKELERVSFQTYGCDLVVILKHLTSLRSMMPKNVVDDIRKHIADNDGYNFVKNNLGDSGERAYLMSKFANEITVPGKNSNIHYGNS